MTAGTDATVRRGVCSGCLCTAARACAGGCAWANADETFCTACVRAIFQGPIEQAVALLARAPADIARRIAGVLLPRRDPHGGDPPLVTGDRREPPLIRTGPGGEFIRDVTAEDLTG
jgi:hypothetical protein